MSGNSIPVPARLLADAQAFFDEASKACGGVLVCDVCRRTQPVSVSQAAEYLRDGWPECHGYTMTLATERRSSDAKAR